MLEYGTIISAVTAAAVCGWIGYVLAGLMVDRFRDGNIVFAFEVAAISLPLALVGLIAGAIAGFVALAALLKWTPPPFAWTSPELTPPERHPSASAASDIATPVQSTLESSTEPAGHICGLDEPFLKCAVVLGTADDGQRATMFLTRNEVRLRRAQPMEDVVVSASDARSKITKVGTVIDGHRIMMHQHAFIALQRWCAREIMTECPDHGILKATDLLAKLCPYCGNVMRERLVIVRTNAERIVVAILAVVIMAISFVNSATDPQSGIIVPWQTGATSWNVAAFVSALIVVGYVWTGINSQGAAFRQTVYVDNDVVPGREIFGWSWLRLLNESFLSLSIGLTTGIGWYFYWYVIRGAKG